MKLINPELTKIVEYKDAEFEVGLLPLEVKNYLLDNRETKTIKKNIEGEEVTEIITHDKRLDMLTVKFGLRNIKNILDFNNKQVEFSTSTQRINGKDYQVVSDILLELLSVINVIGFLSMSIWNFNILPDGEKKTSN